MNGTGSLALPRPLEAIFAPLAHEEITSNMANDAVRMADLRFFVFIIECFIDPLYKKYVFFHIFIKYSGHFMENMLYYIEPESIKRGGKNETFNKVRL
jgi:hypothetical protein